MLGLVSWAAAVVAAALGWTLMVVLPSVVFVGVPAALLAPQGDVSIFRQLAEGTMACGFVLLLVNWLGYRLCPVRLRLIFTFPGSRPQGKQVWVTPGKEIQAYALAGLGRGAIVLSEGAAALPPDEVAWVVAHERSHLQRGDAAAKLWWQAGVKTLGLGIGLARLLNYFGRRMPFLRLLAQGYFRLALLGLRGAYSTFRLCDRHIGRMMEYRADRDAARATSPLAGIKALSRLRGPLEPHFNLFASHPPSARRIERLMELMPVGESAS